MKFDPKCLSNALLHLILERDDVLGHGITAIDDGKSVTTGNPGSTLSVSFVKSRLFDQPRRGKFYVCIAGGIARRLAVNAALLRSGRDFIRFANGNDRVFEERARAATIF